MLLLQNGRVNVCWGRCEVLKNRMGRFNISDKLEGVCNNFEEQ